MKHESFFNFINIWDLINVSLAITISIVEISLGKIISAVSLFLNITILIMVMISYVIYYNKSNYGLFIHRFYSITRLVLISLEILFFVIAWFVLIFAPLPKEIRRFKILIIIGIIPLFLFAGLNLYWSILFMKIIARRSRLEDSQEKISERSESVEGRSVVESVVVSGEEGLKSREEKPDSQ